MVGARPIVDYMFFDFALDALGELFNQTAKIQYMSDGRLKMPIVLRGCIGVGQLGRDAPLGQLLRPASSHLPGFRVVVPTTPRDAKGLLKTAIRSDDPVVLHGASLAAQRRKGLVPDEE